MTNDEPRKPQTQVSLDTEVAEELLKLKQIGDSYSDVIRRLLKIASQGKIAKDGSIKG